VRPPFRLVPSVPGRIQSGAPSTEKCEVLSDCQFSFPPLNVRHSSVPIDVKPDFECSFSPAFSRFSRRS
jgi:hypothetical protein